MKKKTLAFSSLYCSLFRLLNRKSMFAVLHSDINSVQSGLLHFTGKPCCKNCSSAKVKDGIINFILRSYLIDQYNHSLFRQFVSYEKMKCCQCGFSFEPLSGFSWHVEIAFLSQILGT